MFSVETERTSFYLFPAPHQETLAVIGAEGGLLSPTNVVTVSHPHPISAQRRKMRVFAHSCRSSTSSAAFSSSIFCCFPELQFFLPNISRCPLLPLSLCPPFSPNQAHKKKPHTIGCHGTRLPCGSEVFTWSSHVCVSTVA